MSILRRFFGYRPRQSAREGKKQVCIVDASGLMDKKYREHNGQTSPRDNFFILKNIAHFAQREEIEMTAVFVGRPLREAGEGDSFKGITVYYAPDEKSLPQKIASAIRSCSSRQDALVITDDQHVEKEAAGIGVPCMRLTTFRKAMTEGNGEREHDRPRRTAPSKPPQPENEQIPEEPAATPAVEEKSNKNVLDLIDPI